MAIPTASQDLHAYKAWRNSLVPLPENTIIQWICNEKYSGNRMSDDIKMGQCFLLGPTKPGIFAKDDSPGGLVYQAIQCTKSGKLFKREFRPYVEAIARWLDEDKIRIIS